MANEMNRNMSRFVDPRQQQPRGVFDFTRAQPAMYEQGGVAAPAPVVTPPPLVDTASVTAKMPPVAAPPQNGPADSPLALRKELLDKMIAGYEHQPDPNAKEYKPGWKRLMLAAVAGGLSGYSGEGVGRSIDIGRNIRDAKYNDATQKWQAGMGGLEKQLALEKLRTENADLVNKDYRAGRGDLRDELTTNAGLLHTQAQIDNLGKQTQLAGGHFITDQNTGESKWINVLDRSQDKTLGKFGESLREADIRNLGQHNAVANADQTRDQANYRLQSQLGIGANAASQNLGNTLARGLAEHQADLARGTYSANRDVDYAKPPLAKGAFGAGGTAKGATYIPATQMNAADKLAITKAVRDNPQFEKFITRGQNGAITSAQFDEGAKFSSGDALSNWNAFNKNIEDATTEILNTQHPAPAVPGGPTRPVFTPPAPAAPAGRAGNPAVPPPSTPLNAQDPKAAALRAEAIKDITDNEGPAAAKDEANIQKIMAWISAGRP